MVTCSTFLMRLECNRAGQGSLDSHVPVPIMDQAPEEQPEIQDA